MRTASLSARRGLRLNAGALLASVGLLVALMIQIFAPGLAVAAGIACFVLGLPHGAGDEQSGTLRPLAPVRIAAYLIISAAIAALYLAQPLAGLALFLALSSWHFARGDKGAVSPIALSVALVAVGGSMLFQPHATGTVLSAITGVALPTAFTWVLAAVGLAGVALTLATVVKGYRGSAQAVAAVIAVTLLHPVLAVGVIFLTTHALPIQISQIEKYGTEAVWRAVALPSILAIVGTAALALAVVSGWLALPVVAAIAFALATPHMITERLER